MNKQAGEHAIKQGRIFAYLPTACLPAKIACMPA